MFGLPAENGYCYILLDLTVMNCYWKAVPTVFIQSDTAATIFFRCSSLCGYYLRVVFLKIRRALR